MREPKWTKERWIVGNDATGKPLTVWRESGGPCITSVFDNRIGADTPPMKEAIANARLIATAPELYEALKEAKTTLGEAAKVLARDFPSFANNVVNQCAIRCGDALAKARGE